MERSNKHKRQPIEPGGNSFLNDQTSNKNLAQVHEDYLGMTVPDNYFVKSKQDILKHLPMTSQENRTVFGLKPMYAYSIAASIVLLVGMFFWVFTKSPDVVPGTTMEVADIDVSTIDDQDILITSLLVPDSEINTFVEAAVLEKVVVEAEQSEEQLENLFINSLLIDDSKVKDYIEKGVFEHVVM